MKYVTSLLFAGILFTLGCNQGRPQAEVRSPADSAKQADQKKPKDGSSPKVKVGGSTDPAIQAQNKPQDLATAKKENKQNTVSDLSPKPPTRTDVVGLYNRSYYGPDDKPVPTGDLDFTADGKIVEDGVHTANWTVEDGKVLVTILNERFGVAVLQKEGEQLVGVNTHQNGATFKWVLTKTERPAGVTVRIRFIFKCGDKVNESVALNRVTLRRGNAIMHAQIEDQTAIIDNVLPNTRWDMNAIFNNGTSQQVCLELPVDGRPLQERTCTVGS